MIAKKIKIKGFRGFVKEKEFDLTSPITILFGENGRGKSSLLNAFEWCLFGTETVGKNTGIRERIDWEIKNRISNDCYVEIESEKNGNNYLIKRVFKSKTKDELYLTDRSNNSQLEGDEAKKKLNELLNNYTFRDFMSSVYQHQEIIRFILTQEPKDRNEAMDRLLGLSEYRNIIDGINGVKIKGDELENEISNLEDQIKIKIKMWQEQIDEKKNELNNIGIHEEMISEEGSIKLCEEIKKKISDFSSKSSIQMSDAFEKVQPKKTGEFIKKGREEIRRLGREMPDIKEQERLFKERSALTQLLSGLNALKGDLKDKKDKFDSFCKEKGSLEDLEKRCNELRGEIERTKENREEVSLLGTIIENSIKYLKSEKVEKDRCPVCGTVKENLLQYLEKEYKEKYEQKISELSKQIETQEKEKENIEKMIANAKQIKKEHESAKEILENKESEIKRKHTIPDREDVSDYLKNKIKEIEDKEKEIKTKVGEKQKVLSEIENEITKVDKIIEILKLKAQREKAREIEKTEIWNRLKTKSEEFKKLYENCKIVIDKVKEASQEEAKTKIESIKDKVKEYFNRITQHPLIKELQVEVTHDTRTGVNSYAFVDRGKEVTPILSQGQYNSLALSVFLSMGGASDVTPFPFIMFDDPSQSLGSSEKENFVKILNEIAEKKNLIISTMDNELFEKIKDNITKQKKKYIFERWDPNNGPTISQED